MLRRVLIGLFVAAAVSTFCGQPASAEDGTHRVAVPDARTTAPLAVPAGGTIRVAVLIAEGAQVVDFSGPWGVFESVTVGAEWRRPFQLYTVAASKEPVRVSGGMTLVPDHAFAAAPAPDIVVVPALRNEALALGVLDWLRAVQKRTAVMMSVCNGSFVLARAGLLDGRKATAHHGAYGMLAVMYPRVRVLRALRYVEDEGIATAGGLTSGVDLALRVVERYFGRDVARQTAEHLEYQGTGWMYPHSNERFVTRPTGTAEHPICPVCEAQLERKTLRSEHAGKPYWFCSDLCKAHFAAQPKRYVN